MLPQEPQRQLPWQSSNTNRASKHKGFQILAQSFSNPRALMASVKRMIQSGIRFPRMGGINADSTINRHGASPAYSYRSLSSKSSGGKRGLLVEALAMVRILEAQGMHPKDA